jgi:CRISPR system Cascade subunit CasA
MQNLELEKVEPAPVFVSADWQAANTSTVFSHAHELRKGSLSAAEAARTVLRLHAVDVPGLKSAHPRSGANRSAVSSVLLNSLNIWILGEDLWETLMLNLTEYNGINSAPFGFKDASADLPAWERPSAPPCERLPKGPVDLLTFAYRRVRLFWTDDRATAIAVTKGDSFPKDVDPVTYEWSLPFLFDPKAKLGQAMHRPVRASMERQLWRDAPVLIQSAQDHSSEPRRHFAPTLIDWVARLGAETKNVPQRLRLQVFSIMADKAKPLGWFSQAMGLPVRYLHERRLWQRLHDAVALAERYEECLRTFKGSPYHELCTALKQDAKTHDKAVEPDAKVLASFDGKSRYWNALEPSFLKLLDTLPDSPDPQALEADWEDTLAKIAEQAFQDSIAGITDRRARTLGLAKLKQRLSRLREGVRESSLA